MAKDKTVFFCQSCGAQSPKWIGKCPHCNEWNSYVEEVVKHDDNRKGWKPTGQNRGPVPQLINNISFDTEQRLDTTNQELNRVLGGGLVQGSIVLVGGEPGIGKSTLMLQLALNINGVKVLYVSGEESEQQIRMRAERVGIHNNDCYILAETGMEEIFRHIEAVKPGLIIMDSVQTLQTDAIESSPGSISQIRECASQVQRFAKISAVPVFLIGHITKDGNIAGPKILEHMVDVVLQFEGDTNYGFRILRSVKNRFGSTAEIGIFEMQGNGLREITNPSEILLSHQTEVLSGVAVSATMEGQRPLLIEIQSLVSAAAYGTPQRSATGFDLRRLSMLLAVLEKRGGFRLGNKDVFLNVAGGIRVDDPAADLAVIAAIMSSHEDVSLPKNTCFAAEVGLSGELRSVSRIEQRIAEAERIGFESIVISRFNSKSIATQPKGINIIQCARVDEVYHYFFT
jgi:DNA repair protein RadA/Sms